MTTTDATPMATSKKTLPTHELFDVQERPNQKPFWNRVGAAFLNKDRSHTLLVYQPGLPTPKRLQLRTIDRSVRPLKEGADAKKSPTHELFVVIDVDGAPNEWKRVGVGFTNRDGSLSLIIDDGVRDGPKARFQMRERRERVPSNPPPNHEGGSSTSSPPPPPAAGAAVPRTVVRKRQAA